jgi:O-antigen ligase
VAIPLKAYFADFKGKTIWSTLLPVFIALYLLFSMISISVSQIFLFFSFISWLVMLIKEKQKFTFPAFFWPIIAYVALSLVSAALSVNPKLSIKDSKELLLFLIVPIVFLGFSEEKVLKKTNLSLLASAYASCFYSYYYFFFKAPWPWYRISGFMGQVMTYAGLLLLFSCMALSLFLFFKEKTKYLWGIGFSLALFSIILTQTRNAWLGITIAAVVIIFIYKPKVLIIIPIIITIFYIVSPKCIKNKINSAIYLNDKSSKQRIEYIKAGIKIIRDYPIFGTGPDTVDIVFKDTKYGLSDETKKNVHLHNNILQTAAERGIPTLIAWLTFMIMTFLLLLRLIKNKDPALLPFAVAALAALIGLNVAGLFEYNFADSEITALFLYMITVPFALDRIQKRTASIQNNKLT